MNDEAASRAAARKSWPVRKFRLGEEPPDDLSATTTVAERIAMVWQLTQDSWASAGRPIPSYSRQEIPIRIFDPGSRRS